VDGSVASWRFKELDRPWPFVLITSPADHRLIFDPTQPDQVPVGAFSVRAKVFGDAVVGVSLNLEDGAPITMIEDPTSAGRWKGEAPALVPGRHSIDVEATIADGAADRDSLRVLVADAPASERPRLKVHAGHDLHSIGSWPEHGLLGTQLGPNKNGRKW
jgi:hypothetical protein